MSSTNTPADQQLTLKDKLIPSSYTPWVKKMAWALALANIFLIISGGIVRLTGSGLGCDSWPKCTSDGSWTTTPEMGIHGIVEFGNRMLTFVLMVVTVLAFLSILRIAFPRGIEAKALLPKLFTGLRARDNRYSDLFNLTLLLLWGIPVQAVVGGISVWQKLNPWMITAHYYLSAIMIALAAVYLNRVYRYFEGTSAAEKLESSLLPTGSHLLRTLGFIGAVLVAVLIFVGTVVTGTGPHAGDPATHRHPFDPVMITRLHGIAVWVYCATLLAIFLVIKKYALPKILTRSALFVLLVLLYQAIVGYTQYFNGLPIWLVELHLVGSGFFTLAATSLIERQLTLTSVKQRELALERIQR
ncbi:MAG: COX15/CtaA family protein [Rothia sp. (in: high G+C Gram-positive bacteria)]|nr:COX15/CtaA family protein [Rothia sp. (in: high G+C Gram-positive bacteria)]